MEKVSAEEKNQSNRAKIGMKPWLNFLVVFGFLIVFLCAYVGVFSPRDFLDKTSVVFLVNRGEGTSEIAQNLSRSGLIRSSALFKAYVFIAGISHKLQAGHYALSPSMAPNQIAQKFAKGDSIKKLITIPEGFSVQDIASELEEQGIIKKENFLAVAKSFEGYLFPDSYEFTLDDTGDMIVNTMRSNFNLHFTQDLRNETAKQKKTIFQVVTMASILEKEVKTLEDKKIVAGILWKRLTIGMALQVDSAPQTYKQRGLPASPIANPGIESIQAALYPAQSPYLYYLSTPSEKTIFSKTLEEHNLAKARYLKGY